MLSLGLVIGLMAASVPASPDTGPEARLYRAQIAAAAASLRLSEIAATRAWLDDTEHILGTRKGDTPVFQD